ncbi:LysR family transcriptional regulator [uncultured Ferrimonas sp.]|uniref:LysR family transcriptional regulator n=1 Tax=uncultured Ferrimonas sp. TaxID=432640 RepID=UPI0026208B1F|nr:LysR family transcriptional regulator [uncultured Ferrimonas sp.]
MLNLQQLDLFVHCAAAGSFSAAARKLGKAQSAVSQGIANLEIDLGQTLFDRSSRKPTLTPQGQQLLQQAKAVLQQAQELQATAEALSITSETNITLAVDPAVTLPRLYQMLARFSERFPATTITLNLANSDVIPNLVKRGEAQLGLMLVEFEQDMPVGVELGLIGQLPFYTVCHPQHPLAQLPSIGRSELSQHRQLQVKSSDGRVAEISAPLSPKVFYCNDFDGLKQMAQAKLGWCYLPAHLAQPAIDLGLLVQLSLRFDLTTWTVPIDRVTTMGSGKGPALSWLIEHSTALLD